MTEDEFWSLVRQLGGVVTEESIERLTAVLATRPEAEITSFADQLAEVLYRLDTPAHAEQDLVDPESGESLGLSDDSFLYVRAGTVAAGRAVYERALIDPAALLTTLDAMDGEFLLSVAPDAWERATDLAWDHETPLSYETGSNWQAWGTEEPHDDDPWVPPWLQLHSSYGIGWQRVGEDGFRAHSTAQDMVHDSIVKDPAWQAWWKPAGIPDLELNFRYAFEPDEFEKPRARGGKRRAQAVVYFGIERMTAPTSDRLRASVEEDFLLVFGLVRDAFSLAVLPPLPGPVA
ncbi:DUF4240 domain-containing protein [Cryptosporangium phraense]|uniref:DUF4240 domain-containing protein n=1 Tax=Cryptosporangium phraense TaxID=2593070 RepID=UPI0014789941|nr:DUF4240 domain-containing protein [Cryptosporangium phraense]